ncbi:MAG: LemA family protein [Desulfobacterales bacterium]|nr:LemA family protein [Desulfobacterales bacterium]
MLTRNKNMSKIIESTYGKRYYLTPTHEFVSKKELYMNQLHSIVNTIQSRWMKYMFILLIGLVIAGSIYYYNMLVSTQQDVFAYRGKVETLLQRRNDLATNLSKAVLDYSIHERNVLTAVVTLRTMLSKEALNQPELKKLFSQVQESDPNAFKNVEEFITKSAGSPLARLMAVGEQYPDLKLSNAFLNLMNAIIEVEKDLANQRLAYTDRVNTYTTIRIQFPIYIYSYIFGFKDIPHFESSQDAKAFKTIVY